MFAGGFGLFLVRGTHGGELWGVVRFLVTGLHEMRRGFEMGLCMF